MCQGLVIFSFFLVLLITSFISASTKLLKKTFPSDSIGAVGITFQLNNQEKEKKALPKGALYTGE